MKTMTESKICPQCGIPIAADSPDGTCPQCLMALGMKPFGSDAATLAPDQTPGAAPPVEQLASKFPNLEILHLIGHGGMGAVYQARQTNLDRIVALKILSPRLSDDPSFTERFMREARTLAKLSHPNIVTVFDFGRVDDLNYLIMEYVDGVNLRDVITSDSSTPADAMSLVSQICEALQYAHNQNVVHRDIKPENILVTQQGHVKIADFGLAKLLEPSGTDFTLTGTRQVLGTLSYMAPEQIEKPDTVDHRADLYSLGVVFYELLTGELPIGRFAVPSEKAAVSDRLDDVVLRTLEKEPDRRFQQASQIQTAVNSLASQGEESVIGSEYVERVAAADGPRTSQGQSGQQTSERVVMPVVPFQIEEVFGGLATAYGIARLTETRLELEFEIRDFMDAIKSDLKVATVPLDQIASVRYKSGIFGDSIAFQTDSMSSVKEVPTSRSGAFSLNIKKKNAELGNQLVDNINRQLARSAAPQARSPMPPVKQANPLAAKATTIHRPPTRSSDQSSLMRALLLFGFLAVCIFLGLALIVGAILFTSTRISPNETGNAPVVQEDGPGSASVSVSGSAMDMGTTIEANRDSNSSTETTTAEAVESDSDQ